MNFKREAIKRKQGEKEKTVVKKAKKKQGMGQTELFKEIRRAVDTGKVVFGKKQSEKRIVTGKLEMVVVSNNAPKIVSERMRHLGEITRVPVMEFNGTGLELGYVCGKPFTVSVMGIEKTGKSRILSALK